MAAPYPTRAASTTRTASVNDCLTVNTRAFYGAEGYTYVADLQVNPGNSGGPVYAIGDASVLGVCVASRGSPVWLGNTRDPAAINGRTLMQFARLSEVIPSEYVIELVTQIGGTCEVF